MWAFQVMTVLIVALVAGVGFCAYFKLAGRGRGCKCGLGRDCPALHEHCNYAEPSAWPKDLVH